MTFASDIIKENKPASDVNRPNRVKRKLLETHSITKNERFGELSFICSECHNVITISLSYLGLPANCCKCNQKTFIPETQFSPQVVIDDFVIIEKIATGGVGTIYKAYQRSLKRHCAIKVIKKSDPGSEKLFDEAQMMAMLIHRNIVQCYAVNHYNNFNYCVMEYIQGENLAEVIATFQKISYLRAMNIIIQVVEALNYAWKEHQITHNDITPANILIDKHDRIKLSDLGLASVSRENCHKYFQGTPEFASPENVQGLPISYHSDMYSLGVVFYLSVTGKLPHTDKDRIKLLKKHVSETPVTPKKYNHKLPNKLVKLIVKLMAKQPENRYTDYDELLEELDRLQLSYNREALTSSTSLTSKLLREHLTSINFKQTALNAENNEAQNFNSANHHKKQHLLVRLSINFTIIIIAILVMLVFFKR